MSSRLDSPKNSYKFISSTCERSLQYFDHLAGLY